MSPESSRTDARCPALVRGGEGGGEAGSGCFALREKENEGKRERAGFDEVETADEVRGRRCVLVLVLAVARLNALPPWREDERGGRGGGANTSSADECELSGVSGQLDSGAWLVVASRIIRSSYGLRRGP